MRMNDSASIRATQSFARLSLGRAGNRLQDAVQLWLDASPKEVIMRAVQWLALVAFAFPLLSFGQVLPPGSPALTPIEVRLRSEPKNAWLEPATLIALIGSLGGIVGILVQRMLHRKDEQRSLERAAEDRRAAEERLDKDRRAAEERLDKERQLAQERAEREKFLAHVLDSLHWFEGKTQPRSIGIGVVEGNWPRFPELQGTWTAILTNQAVYLLSVSGQKDASHERANLHRIMRLLCKPEVQFSEDQRDSLIEALHKNAAGQGLRGISESDRGKWEKSINAA
jgi:hypothetical protein